MTRFISLFSGIGGFDLGFERAGMECVAQVEIDKAARSVLARHFPTVPRFEDVNHVGRHNLPDCDVLCGGFPCQDVSTAGRRAGLAGNRSGLYFEFQRIIHELRPRYVIIENVPGLLSSNTGKDFAIVLAGLTGVLCEVPDGGWGNAGIAKGRADLYRVAWRVLDAQHFGVAQRRRRVFIVASLGTGSCAEILFEREGVYGYSSPRTQTPGKTAAPLKAGTPSRRNGGSSPNADEFVVTGTLGAAHGENRGLGQENEADFLVAASSFRIQRTDQYIQDDIASTINARDHKSATDLIVPLGTVAKTLTSNYGKQPDNSDSSTPGNFVIVGEAFDVRNLRSNGAISGTLQSKATGGYSLNYQNPVAININAGSSSDQIVRQHEQSGTLARTRPEGVFIPQVGVRRLTPTECERLQGFPDGWTLPQSDSARYKQLGNAVAVPVVEWIGRRIMESLQ